MVAEWSAFRHSLIAKELANPDGNYDAEHAAEMAKGERIARTAPETLEGATAYLEWIIKDMGREFRAQWVEPWASALDTLHEGLRRMAQ